MVGLSEQALRAGGRSDRPRHPEVVGHVGWQDAAGELATLHTLVHAATATVGRYHTMLHQLAGCGGTEYRRSSWVRRAAGAG